MPHKGRTWTAFIIGATLTLLQLSVALSQAPATNFPEAYQSLCQWDCAWYQSIAEQGYRSSIPPVAQDMQDSNVAFFPAYPYLGRALHLTTGLAASTSLLIVAQVGSILFWAALWRLLRRWRIRIYPSMLVLLAVWVHPAAFFLVAGYSESLFLATFLLFIASSPRSPRQLPWTAGAVGILMSATRIVGIPAAVFPLLQRCTRALAARRLPRIDEIQGATRIVGIALLGGLAFFAYCGVRFGQPALYMETQRIGWNIQPDYGVLWKWPSFRFVANWDRVALTVSVLAFAILGILEGIVAVLKKSSGLRRRLPLYLTAFGIFYITLSGLASVQFRSTIRYSLPWSILLLLCLAHLCVRFPPISRPLANLTFTLLTIALLTAYYFLQLPYLREFLRGAWFA